MMRLAAPFLAALLIAACGQANQSAPDSEGEEQPARPGIADVAPADFALVPCSTSQTLCFMVLAGGKRLLFGAPAGVGNRFAAKDLANLDGLFLFSLRPEDIEGLDEVRNVSWQAGRPEMLAVTGPTGTDALIEAVNRAYELSDALIFVEDGAPAGGFDAALLATNQEVTGESLLFDTGDLKVRGVSNNSDRVTYRITYRDMEETWHDLLVQPCGAPEIGRGLYETAPRNRNTIVCIDGDFGSDWPIASTWFLVKSDP